MTKGSANENAAGEILTTSSLRFSLLHHKRRAHWLVVFLKVFIYESSQWVNL